MNLSNLRATKLVATALRVKMSGSVRRKRYGVGFLGFKLMLAVWWIGLALALQQVELPDDSWAVFLFLLFAGFVAPPVVFYLWDEARAKRLRQRDVDAALRAIKQPLRRARLRGNEPVDFDPHYPYVSPSGGVVSAIDPQRRMTRLIIPNMIDADGQAFDEAGPADGRIVSVHLAEVAGPRRWMWLLPPRRSDARRLVSLTVQDSDGQQTTIPWSFRIDDKAAEGWHRTFQQWMRDDRRASGATALPR